METCIYYYGLVVKPDTSQERDVLSDTDMKL